MKNILIGAIALLIVGLIAFFLLSDRAEAPNPSETPDAADRMPVEPDGGIGDGAEPLDEADRANRAPLEVIGTSAAGADISAYHFGNGATEVLFVGGIHSGFAPNTATVANELITALEDGTIAVADNLTVTVIPNLNPDATRSPNTLTGRLNKNGVDLNRNFDCEWSSEATWRNTAVSGGSAAFSEPEAAALRDYVEANQITAAVVYYAADGGVYPANCGGPLSTGTANLTSIYAEASGYTENKEFDAYAISGDLTNWLAKKSVPAIGVLLSNYTSTEWDKNKAGIEAVLSTFAQ